MIERTIIDFLRDYYLDLGIKLLSEKDDKYYKDDNEKRAMLQIRGNGKFCTFNEESLKIIIINMLKKYEIFNEEELKIFNHNMTIGKIFHISKKDNKPSVFAKHFKKEYYYLLERMFNFLNTRNNTMHLNNTNENYFSLEFSSILLRLLWLSVSGEIFEFN